MSISSRPTLPELVEAVLEGVNWRCIDYILGKTVPRSDHTLTEKDSKVLFLPIYRFFFGIFLRYVFGIFRYLEYRLRYRYRYFEIPRYSVSVTDPGLNYKNTHPCWQQGWKRLILSFWFYGFFKYQKPRKVWFYGFLWCCYIVLYCILFYILLFFV